jgi:hypothetical protein
MPDSITHFDEKPTTPDSTQSVRSLWSKYKRLWRSFCRAMEAKDNLRERARSQHPMRPDILLGSRLIRGQWIKCTLTEEDIMSLQEKGDFTEAEATQRLALLRQWREDCRKFEEAHGIAEAEAAAYALGERLDAAEKQLVNAPVRTVEDVIFKLRLVADVQEPQCQKDDPERKVVFGLIRELSRLPAISLDTHPLPEPS